MEVEIKSGQNIIQILDDEFINLLKFKIPLAADWPTCGGSVARYYAISNFTTSEKLNYINHLNDILIKGTNEEILTQIKLFLNLFSSGNYRIYIDRNKLSYEFHFIDTESSKSASSFRHEYYPYSSLEDLLFTQPINSIDEKRVNYYEELILKGERPKAIIYYHYYEFLAGTSGYYVLDGHHKLIAYKNLNIPPEFVRIAKNITNASFETDLYYEVNNILNTKELKHYISHKPFYREETSHLEINYNQLLDEYLFETRRIETDVLKLMIQMNKSDNPAHKNWFKKRLLSIENSFVNNKIKFLNFPDYNKMHGYFWNGMDCKSMEDYLLWKEKVFNTDINMGNFY